MGEFRKLLEQTINSTSTNKSSRLVESSEDLADKLLVKLIDEFYGYIEHPESIPDTMLSQTINKLRDIRKSL